MKPIFDRPKYKGTRIALAVAAALAVITAGGVAYFRAGEIHPQVAVRPVATPQVLVNPRINDAPPTEQASERPPRHQGESVPPEPTPKADEFDALVKAGDPLGAYKLAMRCARDQSECGNLTPGQRTQAYPLLLQAVAAHVPGASVYLLDQAPDGTLCCQEIWNNPAYAEWKQNALREIRAAAERGDPLALRQMAHTAISEGKRKTALTYWTAYIDADPLFPKEAAAVLTQQYTAGLPAAEVKVAIANGHARNFGGTK